MSHSNIDAMTLLVAGAEREFLYRRGTSDERVIEQMFGEQNYDLTKLTRFPEIVDFLARGRLLGKRPLIVDAGANIGASPVYFSAHIRDAQIVAIEPEAQNFCLLVQNTHGLGVQPIFAAVGSNGGRVQVVDTGNGYWGYATGPVSDDHAGGIASVMVNDIFEQYMPSCFPFIVKVDIEGGEQNLFADNIGWVAKAPLIVIELHDWLLPKRGSAQPFLRSIAELDRDFVYIGENIFSIANNLCDLLPGSETKAA